MIHAIGDGIYDEYFYGTYDRISPETPIPVFVEYKQEIKQGGVLNVINNLNALGSNISSDYSINSHKTRYVVDNRIVFRSDKEQYLINEFVDKSLQNTNIIVMSDYNKGFLHYSQEIIDYYKNKNKKVIVDPKKPLTNYRNSDIIKLNKKEFEQYTEYNDLSDSKKIRNKLNIGCLIVTLSGDGVYVDSDEYTGQIKSKNHQVADVTGAGDVFLAALSHYIDNGYGIQASCERANILAGISVTKMGTYVIQSEDLKQSNIVFTNGCFDILHKGHIEYLRQSKNFGGKLVVGLNSDASVKKLKGESRPINNQNDRKAVLESLDCVDEVFIFDDETPYTLIKQIKPDIITKGGDYTVETVVGNDLAKVVIIPYVNNYSTTELLSKL